MATKVFPQEVPPCLMSLHRGGLCLAPAIQIHPLHGPMCALHLHHERRSQSARPNLQVRVDAKDLAALDRLAETHKLSRSDAFRRVLHHLPFPRPKVDADTYLELRRVGVNINQIAHRLNCGEIPEMVEIWHYLDALEVRLDYLALHLCHEAGERAAQ